MTHTRAVSPRVVVVATVVTGLHTVLLDRRRQATGLPEQQRDEQRDHDPVHSLNLARFVTRTCFDLPPPGPPS